MREIMDADKKMLEECLSHRDAVFNFIVRMTSDVRLSEDILQETYLKVIRNRHRFEGRSEVKTWVIAIAKNEAFKAIGTRKKNVRILEAIRNRENGIARENPPPDESPEFLDEIKNGCLYALLSCLPFDRRCAFILHVLNGVPVRETAEVLGKSENAVRVLVSRARSTIRDFLCGHCEHISESPDCRCRNLLRFSMDRGLVGKISAEPRIDLAKAELRRFSDEAELLRSLPSADLARFRPDSDAYGIIFSKN